MAQLPDEILEKILCRLPVKCLLRFRCVSKSWLALISNPYFIKLHLKQSVQTNTNNSLFQKNFDLFRVALDSLHDGDVLQPMKIDSIPLSRFRKYGIRSGFSCDGLLCISNVINAHDSAFLWSPSTRKSIKLPYEPTDIAIQSGLRTSCVYRIGYDNINDDYKVVRIVVYLVVSLGVIEYDIKVYSLRSNSWHRPEMFPYCPNWNRFGNSIVCGSLHWISTVKSNLKEENLIVAFDIGTEKYRVLPQPEYSGPYYKLYLDDLGGCLSLSCHYESSTVDMFLLKEYGGKNEHWSRLITLPLSLSRITSIENYYPLKPIVYSKSGKKVLLGMGSRGHVLYNLEEKSVENIRVLNVASLIHLYTCLESLVSINVPAAADTETERSGVKWVSDIQIFGCNW
ncbi:F-box protein CPR1-like [Impatiens glandulifera]|uniref:F-box protein CPR1-like n=1 Tax=Impatiens glandulifera TaxID=253017 RepID=UPI001FB06DDE|nr:F-box protein CPR1-like [Impatiens glandulifera]